MTTPRRGHIHPVGARVHKRLQGVGFKAGTVTDHIWVTAKTKARTQMPYYMVLFDGSSKPESVSASVLYPENTDCSERLF